MNNDIIRRGDIFWIKRSENINGCLQEWDRPAVIVSNDQNNANSQTLEVVFLTTKEKKKLPTHTIINSARERSTVLCEQITSVGIEDIGNYVGTCTPEEMADIDRCLHISLGLTPPTETKSTYTSNVIMSKSAIETIKQLESDLNAARHRETILRELYNDLLTKTLR